VYKNTACAKYERRGTFENSLSNLSQKVIGQFLFDMGGRKANVRGRGKKIGCRAWAHSGGRIYQVGRKRGFRETDNYLGLTSGA